MTCHRLTVVPALALVWVAGCDDASNNDPDTGASSCVQVLVEEATDVLASACPHPSPRVVDCNVVFEGRDGMALRVEAGQSQEVSDQGLSVSMAFFEDEFEGATFSLAIYTDGASVAGGIYQFQDCGPLNQFVGLHGFTGLLRASHPTNPAVDLQMACFVRDPEDPVVDWDGL